MTFREAMQELVKRVTQQDVAREMGVSFYTIRQATYLADASAYRTPPKGWEAVVARLARERAGELLRLADELEEEA